MRGITDEHSRNLRRCLRAGPERFLARRGRSCTDFVSVTIAYSKLPASSGRQAEPRKVTLDGHVPSHRALRLLRRADAAFPNPMRCLYWRIAFARRREFSLLVVLLGAANRVLTRDH